MLAIDSTPDHAFLADLHAARSHALGVLRSILNLANLSPQARADFLKSGRAALALLRESRLAATQILQLQPQFPLPEGGGRGVGSFDVQAPHTSPIAQKRPTTSPCDHQPPSQLPHATNPPAPHPVTTPRHPSPSALITRFTETRATGSPPPPRQPVQEPQAPQPPPHTHNTPLLRRATPTLATHLLTRAGAAP